MQHDSQQPETGALLQPDEADVREARIQALAEILVTLPFNKEMHQLLQNHYAKLLSGKLEPEDYLTKYTVQNAIHLIKNKHKEHSFFLNRLYAWMKQPHSFSAYELVFCALAVMTLLVGLVFVSELMTLLRDGNSRLGVTGKALEDTCSTGLTPRIADRCAALDPATTGVFSLTTETAGEPIYIGALDVTTLHSLFVNFIMKKIPSWISPIAWAHFFTCEQNADGNQLILTGHTMAGTIPQIEAMANTGFPVYTSTTTIDRSLLLNTTVNLAVGSFLIPFCIFIQQGGYSLLTNSDTNQSFGHFAAFERFGKTFGENAKIFGAVYGFLTGVAVLMMSTLLAVKVVSKWKASAWERGKNREVVELMDKLAPSDLARVQ